MGRYDHFNRYHQVFGFYRGVTKGHGTDGGLPQKTFAGAAGILPARLSPSHEPGDAS
jgi:hypothetical protein